MPSDRGTLVLYFNGKQVTYKKGEKRVSTNGKPFKIANDFRVVVRKHTDGSNKGRIEIFGRQGTNKRNIREIYSYFLEEPGVYQFTRHGAKFVGKIIL